MSDKYKNPDKQCAYPYHDSPADYCWTYACHVDGVRGYENMQEFCAKCEYHKIKGSP